MMINHSRAAWQPTRPRHTGLARDGLAGSGLAGSASRCGIAIMLAACLSAAARGDDKPAAEPPEVPFAKQQFQPPVGLRRLSRDNEIWIDLKRKRVVIDGVVCLREGQLEMFACPRQTKEHESVIAVNCKAREAHAGLIVVGAISGRPARFEPEYSPATGSIIDITILWHDETGQKHSARGQDWVRDVKTGKAMKYDWVFAGSGFWTDPENGENFYHADAGDFICVSNFPSATLDVPVESSQANSSLLFESFTQNIPAKGTPVRLVLTPRPAPAPDAKPDAGEVDLPKQDDAKKDDAKKDDVKKDDVKKDDVKKDAPDETGNVKKDDAAPASQQEVAELR